MLRWLTGRGAAAHRIASTRAQIDPRLWDDLISHYAFLRALDATQRQALLARTAWILASKTVSATAGLRMTDRIALAIAAQAALPILNLDPAHYEGWSEIIVYPAGFRIPRTREDEDGVVHEYLEDAAGEAWDGGPVVLSWEDAADDADDFNVVIHEFAHKLDLCNGEADGVPPLSHCTPATRKNWVRVLNESFDTFCRQVELVESQIPPDMDPESEESWTWWSTLPMDPYAATDEAEFFAVSSELFFVNPTLLADRIPRWYDVLADFYQQDPASSQSHPQIPA
ncbi:MAG: zinc-dependent peptidase [Burkholderiaceae bacterium]|nr:zinc-dependent peptidase [Burkholderiaceae bacterium]